MLETLEIQNYKSIKYLSLNCKRINLFIGKPNVGKSNILEAISLLQDGIGSHIRKEDMRNLFFDQDVRENIIIKNKNIRKRTFLYNTADRKFFYLLDLEQLDSYEEAVYNVDGSLYSQQPKIRSDKEPFKIKPYLFKKENLKSLPNENSDMLSLSYPHGTNLFSVLKSNKTVLKEIGALFKEYGYELVIDYVSDHAEIQKNIDGVVYKIPYSLIADTLQRAIFHYCAIASNENNVLLFEEPENNSFPPYIRDLALKIIDSATNQFFIATHSPYLLNTLIAETPSKDIAVNIVTFDNYQTKIKTLTDKELSQISDYGIDMFFNLDSFIS